MSRACKAGLELVRRARRVLALTRTTGTGNPNTPLEEQTRDELYNRARELDIDGRSSMGKSELVTAIRDRS